MNYTMINTQQAVVLFHRLMDGKSKIQVLCLGGEADLGKSHLLKKVFPVLARDDYQAPYVLFDLRNPPYRTFQDVLKEACKKLGGQNCDSYREDAVGHRIFDIRKLVDFLSLDRLNDENSPKNTLQKKELFLTNQFVKDLSKLGNRRLLLLFDTVNDAPESIQTWLMNTLLVQLSRLDHVRVIVAGRSLPQAHPSYANHSRSYQLAPIKDEEAYITYCRNVNTTLENQSIRDFARASSYIPGHFVGLLDSYNTAT